MAVSTPFSLTRDINGYNGFGVQFSLDKYSCTLSASTDTTLTVPATASLGGAHTQTANPFIAIFSFTPGSEVWISNNATAAAPAGNTFAASTSELNPAGRQVQAGDVIHFFTTASNVDVGVTFYALF